MNLFTAAFSKIFKSGNQQVLDKIKPFIVEINNREKLLSSLKNEEFKEKTHFLKKQVLNGVELEKLIPDSFYDKTSVSSFNKWIRFSKEIMLLSNAKK